MCLRKVRYFFFFNGYTFEFHFATTTILVFFFKKANNGIGYFTPLADFFNSRSTCYTLSFVTTIVRYWFLAVVGSLLFNHKAYNFD